MTSTIVTALVGLLCTILSGWFTFLFTRKKYYAEVNSQELKNTDDAFELYKKVTTDAINVQNEKIEQLQRENEALRKQVNDLQMQVASLLGRLSFDETHKTIAKRK